MTWTGEENWSGRDERSGKRSCAFILLLLLLLMLLMFFERGVWWGLISITEIGLKGAGSTRDSVSETVWEVRVKSSTVQVSFYKIDDRPLFGVFGSVCGA